MPETDAQLDMKAYGRRAALVIWPALACLSIWRIAGDMPPVIEKVYVASLWALAVLFLVSALGAWLAWMLGVVGERRASEPRKPDSIFLAVVYPSRLFLVIALFLAGNSILAGLLLAALLGMSALRSLLRKQAIVATD